MPRKKKNKTQVSVKPKKKEKMEITERRPYPVWNDLDDMFNRFRTDMENLFLTPYRNSLMWNDFRTPSTDIVDQGDRYEVIVEIPGIPKEDINIEVTPNSIEISADHEEDTEEQDKNWLRRERSSTSFYRSFRLPEQVKSEKADAEFKDGILMVHLPKIEPTTKHEAKTVKVK